MAWSQPDLVESGRLTFPYWLELAGYVNALKRAPLPWSERLLCALCLGRNTVMKGRGLAQDLVVAGVMLLHEQEWRKARYAPERWVEAAP